jgi:hypothetical protein
VVSANPIAWLMLLIWPLVARQLYIRLDLARTLIWTLLAGYLLLPPVIAINFPVVPDFTKYTVPTLAAFACSWLMLKDRPSFDPGHWPERLLMLVFVLLAFGTVLTNSELLIFLQDIVPAMKLYDSVSSVATQMIGLLPFLLARKYLADDDSQCQFILALMAAGLAYSAPMILETIVSPQLNLWIYGFFQHDFSQTIRSGGFRPVVFLPHGLWVAFFAFICAASAVIVLLDLAPEHRPKQMAVLLYLLFMALICKSAGAMIFTAFSVPLLLFASRRIIDVAFRFSPDRVGSFAFQLFNEELLLSHAAEKPLFGWGGFTRNFLHDEITGRTTVIADGAWIIVLGIRGWFGYISTFGLLALPLFRLAWFALRHDAASVSPYAAALALILAMNLLDMLPNATDIPLTWLIAGALYGYVDVLRAKVARPKRPAMQVVIG